MGVLEMDEGGYVDAFFFISDTREGGKLQFYHHGEKSIICNCNYNLPVYRDSF